jgi:hypothetical protein
MNAPSSVAVSAIVNVVMFKNYKMENVSFANAARILSPFIVLPAFMFSHPLILI